MLKVEEIKMCHGGLMVKVLAWKAGDLGFIPSRDKFSSFLVFHCVIE